MGKQNYTIELGISYIKNKILCATLSIPALSIIRDIRANNSSEILFYYLAVHRTEMIGFEFDKNSGKEIKSGDYDLGVELANGNTCESIIIVVESNINHLSTYQAIAGLGRALGVDSSIYLNNTCKCPESKNNMDSFKIMVEKNLNHIRNKEPDMGKIEKIIEIDNDNRDVVLREYRSGNESLKNDFESMLVNELQSLMENMIDHLQSNDLIARIKIIIEASLRNFLSSGMNNNNNANNANNHKVLNEIYNRLLEIQGQNNFANNKKISSNSKSRSNEFSDDEDYENKKKEMDAELKKLKQENNKMKKDMQMLKEQLFSAEEYIEEQDAVIRKYENMLKK